NLFRDHRVKLWGKWRPSAEARRLGDVAVRLEAAVYRDGYSFEEACVIVEQATGQPADRVELRRILAQVPERPRRRMEGDESLVDLAAPDYNGGMLEVEHRRDAEKVELALKRALATLDPEDQLIVRLHFYDGL